MMGRVLKRGFSCLMAIIMTAGTIVSGSGMTIAKADETEEKTSVQVNLTREQEDSIKQGEIHRIHVEGESTGIQEESKIRIYLWNSLGEPEMEVKVPDPENSHGEWKTDVNDEGVVTARYLETTLTNEEILSFDFELCYETEEMYYQKEVIAEARAFTNETEVSIDGTKRMSLLWKEEDSIPDSEISESETSEVENTENMEADSSTSKSSDTLSIMSAASGALRAAQADSSISSMYNVPVTYYDYLDDQEIKQGWKNPMPYGKDQPQGWTVFGLFNKELALYGKSNKQTTPLYFGNLLGTDADKNKSPRASEVDGHISWLKTFYNTYNASANNSNYLSDYHDSAQGLVYNTLDAEGNLQIKNGVKAPWFSESFLSSTPEGYTNTLGKVFSSRFPFRTVAENGVSYYEFDSNNAQDNVRYNFDNNTFSYGAGTNYGVQDHLSDNWGLSTSDNGGYGFFPFNYKNSSGYNDNWLDYGFGAKMEIRFNLPKNGTVTSKDGNNVPIKFEFTGDDDVWVFIDGKLVLDLGGAHKKAQGTIDFSTLNASLKTGTKNIDGSSDMNAVSVADALNVSKSDELTPKVGHTLTIFYMERGMIESNLKIRFNMQPLEDEFITEKRVETANVNAGIQEVVKSADNFDVTLNTGNAVAAGKEYQLNSGSTGETQLGLFTDSNGTFRLSDGDQSVFKKQFSDYKGQNFTAVETIPEISTFSYDTRWEAVDLENNNWVIQSGDGTQASFTYDKTAGDEFIPVRNKLIYYNTPETTSLDISKTAVDDKDGTYVDTTSEFEFEVLLDIGEKSEDTSYEEDITDPYTIYFQKPDNWSTVNAYCYNSETDKMAEWPGTAMTLVKGNIYKLDRAKNYRYVIFNNGGSNAGDQFPAKGMLGAEIEPPISGVTGTGVSKNYYYLKDGSLICDFNRETKTVTEPGGLLGYQPYQVSYLKNGVFHQADELGIIRLKAGETASITGLPKGAKFKIKEKNTSGYTLKDVTINGTNMTAGPDGYYEGTLSSGLTTKTTLSFCNQKLTTSASIQAHKTLDGDQLPAANSFEFILEGQNPRPLSDGKMSMNTAGILLTAKNDVNGKLLFDTLSYTTEGTYIYRIKENIPEEGEPNYLDYLYDKTVYEVTVVVTSDSKGEYQVDTSAVKVMDRNGITITAPEAVDIESGILFDNIINLEELVIEKQLVQEDEDGTKLSEEDWPVPDEDFWFKIEQLTENETYEPLALKEFQVNETKRRTDGNGMFCLKAEEKATFQKLVVSSKYRVTEHLNSYVYSWDYELKDIIVNDTIIMKPSDGSTGEQTIKKGDNQVIFRNYPLNKIKIVKVDEDEIPLEGAAFKLEFNEGTSEKPDWQAVSGYEEISSNSQGLAVFKKLHAGQYRITEITTIEGHVLLKDPIVITLPYKYNAGEIVNGIEVKQGGLTYTVTFTITNGQAFDLPKSGTKGIGSRLFAGALCLSLAGAGLYRRRRLHSRL